ncbi:MAG: hypothetical protein JNJ54_16305 [Myxococcaceae bacterium]|nr:hypothetical protein [Myxococcaceae bacterium]
MARRLEVALLALLSLAAWVARVSPWLRRTGVLGWAVDYDEGVYLSASALLWQGALPWRDFVFVHPPAVPALLSFATVWDVTPSRALELARWGTSLVAALDVFLAALLVRRHAGFLGACVAAGLLAVWPEVVAADRGVHLEPFLTGACLLAAWKLAADPPRPLTAGLWLGVGLLVKSWAVLWLAAWLIARGRRALPGVVVAVVVAGVVMGPLAVLVPDFLSQVVWFHLARPADGDVGFAARLSEMFVERSVLPVALLVATSWALWRRRSDPFTRLCAAVTALLVVAFLGTAAFWNQYDAHLAFPLAMLCGVGVGEASKGLPRWRAQGALGVVVAALAGVPGLLWVLDRRRDADEAQAKRVELVRRLGPGPVCAFEPHELVMADRWPPVLPGSQALVDSYGQMLLDATRGGARHGSASEAFASEAAQRTVREQLRACPRWLVGWRGRWQLNAPSRALLDPAQLVDPE